LVPGHTCVPAVRSLKISGDRSIYAKPILFNVFRTLSFSVDERIKPNSFPIIRLRTLSQNRGVVGGPAGISSRKTLTPSRLRAPRPPVTTTHFPFFSIAYKLPNLQVSCFQDNPTVRGCTPSGLLGSFNVQVSDVSDVQMRFLRPAHFVGT